MSTHARPQSCRITTDTTTEARHSSSAMSVGPELLTLMLVCLQDGLALSPPALNCTKVSLTGGNTTTRPSKSLLSDVFKDNHHLEFQTTVTTPSGSEGFYTLSKNSSRFESRIGSPVRTTHTVSARHQHRNDDFGRHSLRQSHTISNLHRRPEFYIPSSGTQKSKGPSSSHTSRVTRPNSSHQFADRNTFYRQTGFDERKKETGIRHIAQRIYPYKLGPDKEKPTFEMHSHAYEMSGGKLPPGMSSNIDEITKAKQPQYKMPPSDTLTYDYTDMGPFKESGVHNEQDHHDDHSYDLYQYDHHTASIEIHTTPPPAPKKEAVVGFYRIGFKLYYIPLYAGIVFVFFVLILMLRSISRHKGQVPFDFLSNPPARMLRDDVAERVIRALETSRQGYNSRHK